MQVICVLLITRKLISEDNVFANPSETLCQRQLKTYKQVIRTEQHVNEYIVGGGGIL